MAHRCDLHRRHPSPEDAQACPQSLTVLQPPTRRRRNAIVDQMQPGLDEAVPASPTASWETTSNTAHSSRAATPLELPRATAYPTPSTSQRRLQGPRDHILNGPALHSAPPFTPRTASPAPLPDDDDDDDNIVVHHSYDLLGNLQTTSPFQTTPAPRDRFTTPSPPTAPPPSPMAPRKSRRPTPPPTGFRSRMLEIESAVRRRRGAVDETNAGPVEAATAAVTPLHNPADIALPSIEVDNNVPPGDQLREIRALRRSTADLTRQLAASTERSNLCHLRANIANEHRNRAVADREEAEAQLQAVRDERDEAKGGWGKCTMKCKALFLLVLIFGLYMFYRGVLYEPEFEYIMKRSGEVLDLLWGDHRVPMDEGLEAKWREMTGP